MASKIDYDNNGDKVLVMCRAATIPEAPAALRCYRKVGECHRQSWVALTGVWNLGELSMPLP